MILFFVLFLLLLLLAAQTWALRRCLESVREDYWTEKTIVDCEEEFAVLLSVTNRSRRYLPFVKVSLGLPRGCTLASGSGSGKEKAAYTCSLRPWQEVRFRVPVKIGHRGRYVLRHPELTGGDFLGLREQQRECPQFREVIAAPKRQTCPRLDQALGSFLGDYSVRRFLYEDPVLTAGYREYTGQEPMKQIAWKQSARVGSWMVRQQDHTVEPAVTVLLNVETRESMEMTEAAFSLARTVCEALEERRIKYDFATNASQAGGRKRGAEVAEGLGESHILHVLECLGRGLVEAGRPFFDMLEEAALRTGRNRGLLVITPGEGLECPARNAEGLDRWRKESGGNVQILCACRIYEGQEERTWH